MWHQIMQYIKFLVNSTNQHGVHSPFVYDLVTKCFYDKKKYDDYIFLSKYRKQLYNNNSEITVKDFGAGSKVFKSNDRKISQIAKNAGITKKRALLLYRLSHYLKPASVLELGTSLGLATSALSLANPDSRIITIEGCTETASIAKCQFEKFDLNNITLKVNNFDDELKNLHNKIFDLIYIDGNHNKKATLKYFRVLLDNIKDNSMIIFDDIHWSKEMTEAWEQIKIHKKVTLAIDTFYWGIVIFKQDQAKQHFKIRV